MVAAVPTFRVSSCTSLVLRCILDGMYELSGHLALLQSRALPRSGEELAAFGKMAASNFVNGSAESLTSAVVGQIKSASLSPEQVKRVVESANVAAYQQEFSKEGSAHYVSFKNGPASVDAVMAELNTGGRTQTKTAGLEDYSRAPTDLGLLQQSNFDAVVGALGEDGVKHASAEDEEYWSAFLGGERTVDLSEFKIASDPRHAFCCEARDRLETTVSELNAEELEMNKASGVLYDEVREALSYGYSLGNVVEAVGAVAPSPEYVKVAFSVIGPKLLERAMTADQFSESLLKCGSSGVVDSTHPLCEGMSRFCAALTKCAELNRDRAVLAQAIEEVKTAGGAVNVPFGWTKGRGLGSNFMQNLKATAQRVGKGAQYAGEVLHGTPENHVPESWGENLAKNMPGVYRKAAKGAVYAAPVLAGSYVATKANDALRANPYTAAVGQAVSESIPGTVDYANARARADQQAAMAQGAMYGGSVY